MKALIGLLLVIPAYVIAGALDETRYCGVISRDGAGNILRRADVIRAFKKRHPCPIDTLEHCHGWQIDHVIPLAVGGCDSVSNMQWLPNSLKTCAGKLCKDRWERKVYAR